MKFKPYSQIIYIISIFFIFFLSGCDSNQELINKGNDLVVLIENYKEANGVLPEKLDELNDKHKIELQLNYVKWDSENYMVYFGTSLGESMIYYSDTGEWDYRLRGMGKNDN